MAVKLGNPFREDIAEDIAPGICEVTLLGNPFREDIAEDIAPGICEVALLGNPLRDGIAEDITPGISEVALGTPKGGAREDIEGGNNELIEFGELEVDNPLSLPAAIGLGFGVTLKEGIIELVSLSMVTLELFIGARVVGAEVLTCFKVGATVG